MLNLSLLIDVFSIMFSPIGLFKNVACPEQPQCSLPNCIFEHQVLLNDPPESRAHTSSLASSENKRDYPQSNQANKRRRLDTEPSESHLYRRPADTTPPKLPGSILRAISPPPDRGARKGSELATTSEPGNRKHDVAKSFKSDGGSRSSPKSTELSLNPRMIQKPPASHAIRLQLITMLHERMRHLNEEVKNGQHPSKAAVLLSSQGLLAHALNEEEKIAIDSPVVYSNVIKLRIVKLRKMKVGDWIEERLKQLSNLLPEQPLTEAKTAPKVIDTHLSLEEEIAFLPRIFADQSALTGHGYVTTPPSDGEIEKARCGVEASQGWEQCDRCKTRFQVFPGRRKEDGALTSGGSCLHHPGKPRRPTAVDKQTKADRSSRDSFYTCCNEGVSVSAGCTTAATHVFKISSSKRLASVMQFETTPSKPDLLPPMSAVCFDCEMGYTTLGLELIRLTATSWPSGNPLIDVLVRPMGEVLDLNSRFSGVWPKDFANAPPYDPPSYPSHQDTSASSPLPSASPLPIVPSPFAARALLFTHLHLSTPLIGHALENDLNAARIIHPSIIDTVLLYPHPRGLPLRSGLKALMKNQLDRDIQMGGAEGHDSGEDARAAGDLVRLKVGQIWKGMRKDGWIISEGRFVAPSEGSQKEWKAGSREV